MRCLRLAHADALRCCCRPRPMLLLLLLLLSTVQLPGRLMVQLQRQLQPHAVCMAGPCCCCCCCCCCCWRLAQLSQLRRRGCWRPAWQVPGAPVEGRRLLGCLHLLPLLLGGAVCPLESLPELVRSLLLLCRASWLGRCCCSPGSCRRRRAACWGRRAAEPAGVDVRAGLDGGWRSWRAGRPLWCRGLEGCRQGGGGARRPCERLEPRLRSCRWCCCCS
jgi:hypothetical protein